MTASTTLRDARAAPAGEHGAGPRGRARDGGAPALRPRAPRPVVGGARPARDRPGARPAAARGPAAPRPRRSSRSRGCPTSRSCPAAGRQPPPWRWGATELALSAAHHAAYAVAGETAWRAAPPAQAAAGSRVDLPRARGAGPTYFAVGRISRASRFCSRMCADQPGDPRAGEHRREEVGGDLGGVEHDGRPELDVRGQDAVGLARVQLGQRRLLERLGDLEAPRADLARGPAQDARPGVLGAVDAVAEAHEPLAAVQQRLDVALGVARCSTSSSIFSTRDGAPPCSGPAERADRARQRRGDVGAGRGDDARGERRGVHPVLGGGDPVGVDRLDVVGVGLAAPADQEALGDRRAPCRSRSAAPTAGRARARTGRRRRAPCTEARARCRGPARR